MLTGLLVSDMLHAPHNRLGASPLSSLRSRRTTRKFTAAVPIRDLDQQLSIVAAAYRIASQKPLESVAARRRLRSLALATVMLIDAR